MTLPQAKEIQINLNRDFNRINNEIETLLGIASNHPPLEKEPANLILHVKDSQKRYRTEINRLENILNTLKTL